MNNNKLSPDAVTSGNTGATTPPDPIKFIAKLGDVSVEIYERTQSRGRGVGKKFYSPNLDSINGDNYSKIFSLPEFWENFVRPNLRKLSFQITDESVIRDEAGVITKDDQDKWINMFFAKVSAVSETIKILKARKEELWQEMLKIMPPSPEQMPEFLAIAQKIRDVESELADKD